jgi:hypothetical protein
MPNTTDNNAIDDLPLPAGAATDGWTSLTEHDEPMRFLTWSHHDAAGMGICVDGEQHANGTVHRHVSLYGHDLQLTADQARALAAALVEAADEMDGLL